MPSKFLLTSTLFSGEVIFEFNDKEWLIAFINKADMTEAQYEFLASHMPLKLYKLEHLAGRSTTMTLKPVDPDLSFDAFWERYDYKVGNKKRSEKLWNELSEADKSAVFENIPRYNYYLSCKRTIERLYPETYLSQRRFETDFRKLVNK